MACKVLIAVLTTAEALWSQLYLIRWTGPVNTSNDPYKDTSNFSSSEIGLPLHKHVQNVTFLPNRNGPADNLDIKKAIMNYGAVTAVMYFDPISYSSTKHNYYYNGTTTSNHLVTIVGWDDSFSKNNFST